MEKELTFSASYRDRYPNALHAEYHDAMYRIVTGSSVEPEKMYLKPMLMAEWRANIDLEQQQSRTVVATIETAEMKEGDKGRDKFVGYTFHRIRMAEASPYPEEAAAGKRLALVADAYSGLQNEAADMETGHIRGLLLDLRQEKYAADIELLDLGKTLDDLEAANEAYVVLHDQRLATVTAEKLPNNKEVRRLSDGNLDRVLFFIQAGYLISENAADKAAIKALVDLLNAQTDESRARYNQMMAQKYGPGSGVPSGGSGDGADGPTDGTDGPESGETPDTTPDSGETGGGSETPDTGGSDTGGGSENGGGETPTPTPGGGDDDEEVVG